jgi:hypothetical protein
MEELSGVQLEGVIGDAVLRPHLLAAMHHKFPRLRATCGLGRPFGEDSNADELIHFNALKCGYDPDNRALAPWTIRQCLFARAI